MIDPIHVCVPFITLLKVTRLLCLFHVPGATFCKGSIVAAPHLELSCC
jgi:hypothetical protein